MDFGIYSGDTNKTIYVRLRDSTTGLAKTGLAWNDANAVLSYTLPLAARAAIVLATQTVTGAHSDGGFVEVDATNCKGLYRVDISDAAIASGDFTVISIEFDGTIEESIEIPLHTRKVNVVEWLATAVTTSATTALPEVDTKSISDDAVAANNLELDYDGTGYAKANSTIGTITTYTGNTKQTADVATLITTVGTAGAGLTNLGASANNWNTVVPDAAGVAPTVAEITTDIWTDTTAGNFTTALSVGKSVMNGVALGTGLTVDAVTGDTKQTADVATLITTVGVAGAGLTNLGASGNNWNTVVPDAAGVAPTTAEIATGVWTDTTAGDFTTALSVGKSVMNGVALGTGLTIVSVSGSVGSMVGTITTLDALDTAQDTKHDATVTQGNSAWITSTLAATDIVSSGAITTLAGAVVTVTTTGTTTTNTDLGTLTAGMTSLPEWLGLLAGDQVANVTALAEIKLTGAGAGQYNEATDSQEAIANAGGGDATAANQTTLINAIGTVSDLGGGATLAFNNTDMAGATFLSSTDSLEDIRDRGDTAWTTGAGGADKLVMVDTTILSLSTQTGFTLSAGSTDNKAYEGCTIVIEDAATSTQKAIGVIDTYTGVSRTVALLEDPGVFTMANTDKVYILAEKGLKPTTSVDYHVDVSSGGGVGINWANVENPTTAVDLAGTDIQLADTTTTVSGTVGGIAGTITTLDALDTAQDTQHTATIARGDIAWTTGGGGSITDILNVQPSIPTSIDLADTATVRIGLMLTNALDDLPSAAEITPGTISIDRKAIGGTTWSAIVTNGACLEQAGLVYYDEVFDSGTGYAEGDSIRITFKSQKITVSANDYVVTDANGVIFQTEIRQTMAGTNSAALASTFTGITTLAEWLGAMAGKQVANSSALTEIKASGAGSGTYNELTDSLEALQSGQASAITVTPIVATVSAGEVSENNLIAYTETTPSFAFTIVDSAGAAIDLSSETLNFNVYSIRNPNTVLFTVASPTITISGASSNIATVPLTEVHTAEDNVATYQFNLRAETANLVYARGSLEIQFEADAT